MLCHQIKILEGNENGDSSPTRAKKLLSTTRVDRRRARGAEPPCEHRFSTDRPRTVRINPAYDAMVAKGVLSEGEEKKNQKKKRERAAEWQPKS